MEVESSFTLSQPRLKEETKKEGKYLTFEREFKVGFAVLVEDSILLRTLKVKNSSMQ